MAVSIVMVIKKMHGSGKIWSSQESIYVISNAQAT